MYLPRAASLFRGIKNPDIECPATRHVERPRATRTQQPELLLGHGRTMAAADSQLLHSSAVKRLVVVVTWPVRLFPSRSITVRFSVDDR